MFILDTDHATFYQQGHPELQKRLQKVSPDQIATTVITYEEQITGRLAVLRRTQASQKRVQAFFWLQQTLTFFVTSLYCRSMSWPITTSNNSANASFVLAHKIS